MAYVISTCESCRQTRTVSFPLQLENGFLPSLTLFLHQGLDRYLSNHIKHLVMASHVKAKLEIPNNYALSLVEQELCSGAEVFIGSTKSSWSQNVIDERYGGGKQSSHHNLWWHLIV